MVLVGRRLLELTDQPAWCASRRWALRIPASGSPSPKPLPGVTLSPKAGTKVRRRRADFDGQECPLSNTPRFRLDLIEHDCRPPRGERRGAGSRCRVKLSQRVPSHFRGKCAATGDRRRTESTGRHAETSAVRNEALVERDSGGCGRWREQQHLSYRRSSRRRPSTAELGGNLLRCGDGPSDAHGPAAAGAHGDVDAEDAGEERHPRQARRGSIAELSVQQGGDGGELELLGNVVLVAAVT